MKKWQNHFDIITIWIIWGQDYIKKKKTKAIEVATDAKNYKTKSK